MTPTGNHSPMGVRLTDDRRDVVLKSLTTLYADEFGEELSAFRAERIIEFFVSALGPSVYNQAIQDARAFMLDRLEDLDAQYYRDEDTAGSPGADDR